MERIGKYEILEEIGRGGFAVVYKARDPGLDRVVALKVLAPHLTWDPTFAERFRREARSTARLRHPHIVTIYEVGQDGEQPYIAIEYLPGRTLAELLKAEGAMPLERALSILEQIADALDYAHGQGVIHRDVKPSNVMVEETQRGSRATLMDFGLVKAMESSKILTSADTFLGSPEYMAPEQADSGRKDEIGPATDCYALGVVAYEMLTGQVPFEADSPLAVLRGHTDETPPDPRKIREDLPTSAAQVLLKALSKAPGERYPTAGTMVEALRQAERDTLALEEEKAAKRERRLGPRRFPLWVWGAVSALLLALLVVSVLSGPLFRGKTTPRPTVTTTVVVKVTGTPFATDTPITAPTSMDTPLADAVPTKVPTPKPSATDIPLPTRTVTATATTTATPASTPTEKLAKTPTGTATTTATSTSVISTPFPTVGPTALAATATSIVAGNESLLGTLEVVVLEGCEDSLFDVKVDDQIVGSGVPNSDSPIVAGTYDIVLNTSLGESSTRKNVVIRQGEKTVEDFSQVASPFLLKKHPQSSEGLCYSIYQGDTPIRQRSSPLWVGYQYCITPGLYTIRLPCSSPLPPGGRVEFDIEVKAGEKSLLESETWASQLGILSFEGPGSVKLDTQTTYLPTGDQGAFSYYTYRSYWMRAGTYRIVVGQPYVGLEFDPVEIKGGEETVLRLPESIP